MLDTLDKAESNKCFYYYYFEQKNRDGKNLFFGFGKISFYSLYTGI